VDEEIVGDAADHLHHLVAQDRLVDGQTLHKGIRDNQALILWELKSIPRAPAPNFL
jgi:hypothetical protein